MSMGRVKIIAHSVIARVSRIRSTSGRNPNHFLRDGPTRSIPRVARKLSWRDISKLRLKGEKRLIMDKDDKSIARLSTFLPENRTPYQITPMIAALSTDILGHTKRTNISVHTVAHIH